MGKVGLMKNVGLKRIFEAKSTRIVEPWLPKQMTVMRSANDDQRATSFQEAVKKVRQAHDLPIVTAPTAKDLSRDQSLDDNRYIDLLSGYAPMKCEKQQVVRPERIKLKLENFLDINEQLFKKKNLPYLPNSYVKSSNFTPVTNASPKVALKSDIKGVLGPLVKAGFFNSIPTAIANDFFAMKFVPVQHYLAAARKSRPAFMFQAQQQLLFNCLSSNILSPKTSRHSFFPSRSAVLRSKEKRFYKELYFNHITKAGDNYTDGVLIVRCFKFANTEEDKNRVAQLFEEGLDKAYKKRFGKTNVDVNYLKAVCANSGIPYNQLFQPFFSSKK